MKIYHLVTWSDYDDKEQTVDYFESYRDALQAETENKEADKKTNITSMHYFIYHITVKEKTK